MCAEDSTLFSWNRGGERTLVIYIEYNLIVVKSRSLGSGLSLCFSGLPVQCCPAADVCLSSVLSTRGTCRAVPEVSRGSTDTYRHGWKMLRVDIMTFWLVPCYFKLPFYAFVKLRYSYLNTGLPALLTWPYVVCYFCSIYVSDRYFIT